MEWLKDFLRSDERERRLHREIERLRHRQIVALINQFGSKIMATLQDIIDNEATEATALSTLATGLQTLLDSVATLQQQLADALAGTTLPPAVQAQIDAAFAASKANTDAVAADVAKLPAPPAA